jgi:cell division protease FtsH
MHKKLKVFIKYFWLRIAIALAVLTLLIFLSVVVIYGIKSFVNLESSVKSQLMAALPFYLVIGIIQAFIFASIYMFFHYYFFFGGGIAKLGQKRIKSSQVNIRWTDVIGFEYVKREVWEIIKLIKDRRNIQLIGGKLIKGILMIGPPGCGKTYLAKAIATETEMPFLSAVGSEFVGIFVGLGAERIKTLFKDARALAELHGGCIIFIDEIDTIARPRVGISGMGGGISHNATVNQLLTELDGLRQTENNLVVIAATNVNEYELDPALMRAGRFDRKIYIGHPGLNDRKLLFEYYLKKINCESSIKADILARKTVGFSPADIANMVRESSLIAIRGQRKTVNMKDLSEAYDRVVFGLRSHIQLSEQEKLWSAYHESGHVIIAYLTHPTDDVIKASIIPRKLTLGYVGRRPPEEVHIKKREWYLANIKTSLGSYVAEKIKFGTTSSGVESDFSFALYYAYEMVGRWGMGKSGKIGNFFSLSFNSFQSINSYPISEKTKEIIDDDVQNILHTCLKEVEEILTKEKDLLEYFAQELLKKEELEYDEIVTIFKQQGYTTVRRNIK